MITRAEKRFLLLKQQGGVCALCGKNMTLDETTMDHRFPKSRGGSGELFNLQAAHQACNRAKGAKIIMRFVPIQYIKNASNKMFKEAVLEQLARRIKEIA